MAVYSEPDLVVPALVEINQHEDGITTGALLIALRRSLRPDGDDLLPLDGRADDRFSQKVRNLKSHNTLERQGVATYDPSNSRYFITEKGRSLVESGAGVIEAFVRQGFSERHRRIVEDRNFDGIVVEEGSYQYISTRVLERSRALREAAIREFADEDGSIECRACENRAEDLYGREAVGMIEMHHSQPLYLGGGQSRSSSISEALKSIVPLCPSCHRMVHLKRGMPLAVDELRKRIAQAAAK